MCDPYILTALSCLNSLLFITRGSWLKFLKVFSVLNIYFMRANSADPDEISHLYLHCLLMFYINAGVRTANDKFSLK